MLLRMQSKPLSAVVCFVQLGAHLVHFFCIESGVCRNCLVDLLKRNPDSLPLRFSEVARIDDRGQSFGRFGIVSSFQVIIDSIDSLSDFRLGRLKRLLQRAGCIC